MQITSTDFCLIMPEILLLGLTFVVLFASLFLQKHNEKVTYILSQAALVISAKDDKTN